MLGTMRFTAPIRPGPNPYVEVPAAVSSAFAPLARAGRITVDGLLNGASVRGTLMPTSGAGHRLYINGGMRAAAGVRAGDTVIIDLTAHPPDELSVPDDLAEGLAAAGARAAFDSLESAHRRELQRYVDDARSPATRAARIAGIAQHALAPARPSRRQPIRRPLWTCPACGNQFTTRNQFHSCARHSLEDVFDRRPPAMRELFDAVHEVVRSFGAVSVVCYQDSVAFMVRARFAGVVPRQRWVNLQLWLPRRVDSTRFARIETLTPNTNIHTVRLHGVVDLDAQLRGWLAEAYAVGAGIADPRGRH